jgi:hypothetical protein
MLAQGSLKVQSRPWAHGHSGQGERAVCRCEGGTGMLPVQRCAGGAGNWSGDAGGQRSRAGEGAAELGKNGGGVVGSRQAETTEVGRNRGW